MSKRFISAAIVFVLLIGILFHGIYSTKYMPQHTEEESKLTETLHIWYTDESLTDYLTSAGVAFHEKNPDIRVIPELVGSSDYLENIYLASLEGENYPDLFVVSNDSLEKAYLSGIASEADASTGVLNTLHFPQVALDAATYKDQLVAYPLYFETSVLAYNRTYLEDWVNKVNAGEVETDDAKIAEEDLEEGEYIDPEEAVVEELEPTEPVTLEDYIPNTIDDILDFAGSYSTPDGVEGIFKWDVTDVFYNYFFVGKYMVVGGPTGDDAQNIDVYNASAISSLQVYQNLNQFFSIDASTSSYNAVLSDFINGKSVFTIVTSDAIKTIRKSQETAKEEYAEALEIAQRDAANRTAKEEAMALAGDTSQSSADSKDSDGDSENSKATETTEEVSELQKKADELKAKVFEMDFARIPMVSDSLESKSLSVTNCIAVNGFSKNMEAANKFAAFATTTQAQSVYQKTGKIAASLDAVYDDLDLLVFKEEYANSVPLSKLMEASNFWVQLEITFTKIWSGEDVQSYVRALSDQLSKQSVDENNDSAK